MKSAKFEELMAEVIARPDEDEPRTRAAAWLAENGEADWAEYIHTSCAAARMPSSDPERLALEDRASELVENHGPRWAAALFSGKTPKHRFSRGFVEAVKAPFSQWHRNGAEWVRRTPLRRAVMTGRTNPAGARAVAPVVAGVESIKIDC